jgi:hypothetical protein
VNADPSRLPSLTDRWRHGTQAASTACVNVFGSMVFNMVFIVFAAAQDRPNIGDAQGFAEEH